MKRSALIAEFIGTFALIFVGVGAIAADTMLAGKSGLVGIALAHGLTIAVMVSATAAISGGHLNPAVTVGALVAGKIDGKNALGYIIAQCLGGIAAALLIKVATPLAALQAVGFGTPALGPNILATEGLGAEAVLTFFLMFAVSDQAILPFLTQLFIRRSTR